MGSRSLRIPLPTKKFSSGRKGSAVGTHSDEQEVVAVLGVRGFGLPTARRLGSGRRLLLGDIDPQILADASETLTAGGYDVSSRALDISDRHSVTSFAGRAAELGRLRAMVLTAGLTGNAAPPERILAVNMIGTNHVIDAFFPLARPGAVAVIMSSSAARMIRIDPAAERVLATADGPELLDCARGIADFATGPGAYRIAKRANQLRVEAAAVAWGRKGARIVTISPGIMATPMSEFERQAGSPIDQTVARVPLRRIGTAEEIAAATEWLVSDEAGYITGTDLLVDGGMTSLFAWGDAAQSSTD